jgi:lipopolysaccharide export system protein LptA
MKNRTKQASALTRPAAILAWVVLGLLSSPASAEKADRDKPVYLEADTVTVDDAKQISTYEGNVVLTQGTLAIKGDKLVVKQDNGGFQHGTVYGNPASFRQKREGFNEYIEGFADRIEYDAKSDKAQLFNHARMKRDQDEVQGNYITYDASTEFFQVIGGEKGTAPGSGRVRAIIQPKNKTGGGSSATGKKP